MSEQHRIVHGRMRENGPFYPRQYVPPGAEPMIDATPLTDEQVARFRAEWRRKMQDGTFGRPPRMVTPLPRRVRLRLAAESAINHAGTWLVYRGHYGAAERLWRLFRMWR